MKPVLVFGQTGQVGREFARIQPPAGWHIASVGRQQADLTRRDQIEDAVHAYRPAAIINTAAYTAVDQAESEPDLAFAVNAHGAGFVAEAAAAAQVPLIHLSTDYVFDGRKAGGYVEDDAPAPLNVYGASKALGEQRVRGSGCRHAILRVSWVFAGHGRNFVRSMLRLAAERTHLRIVADQRGGPTPALRIAETCLAMAQALCRPDGQTARSGTFHYSGRPDTTWFDFAHAIFAIAARQGWPTPSLEPITAADYPTTADRPHNSALDCGKLERIYGISRPDWQGTLENAIDELLRAWGVMNEPTDLPP